MNNQETRTTEQEMQVVELSELELALIGGGIGDTAV